ncbi:T-cell immunoglobulin and mucin domain-containing protein 4-like [Hypomesus transpacificus]|uniref:T-cell immunoglobulin and mucin domain-containing protein 4-like n=1 Tax=Hypomesus transpacificus TaxID=137520 RepID=UPI001F07D53F|nr:T-cell immunoglobulin and mucin domain-containing protein 4-like [Hypomesus transpacificus]
MSIHIYHITMKTIFSAAWLVIYLLTVSECSTLQVVGVEGQNVTLPCRYDASNHGVLPMCWGRGALPSSGCDNQILSSDGSAVKKRTSIRYLLSGDLKQGDISLTILNTTERDAGLYGCRVKMPGWFNDMKSEVRLNVEKTFLPTTNRIPDHVAVTPASHSQADTGDTGQQMEAAAVIGSSGETLTVPSQFTYISLTVSVKVATLLLLLFSAFLGVRHLLKKTRSQPVHSGGGVEDVICTATDVMVGRKKERATPSPVPQEVDYGRVEMTVAL